MDLGFAAASEDDGDWGDGDEDEAPEAPAALVPVQAPAEDRGRSPPRALPPPPADAAPASGDEGPVRGSLKSKIHNDPRTRYFVIKSNNHKNLVLSIENNVWATQPHNEEKFNEALRNAPHVILIFSVNMSGCFQGYAKMMSAVGSSPKTHVFDGYGRVFDVRWLRLDDLDFAEVASIVNPWNDHKSVKVSRDGQELPNDIGARVCKMVDERVYNGDPASYVTDANEVETGGFAAPAAPGVPAHPGAPQHGVPASAPQHPGYPPPHAPSPGAWTPPPVAAAPPLPPSYVAPGWTPPSSWGLPSAPFGFPWGGGYGGCGSSYYSDYSYSYSDSEPEDGAGGSQGQAPQGLEEATGRRRRGASRGRRAAVEARAQGEEGQGQEEKG